MTWSLESPQLALVRRAVETAPMVDGVERQTARAQLRALLDRAAAVARVEALLVEAERIAAAMGRDYSDEGYPAWVEGEKLRAALDGSGVAE